MVPKDGVCVRQFCLCIPLEPKCFCIGFFYIVIHVVWLVEYIDEYLLLEKWKTDRVALERIVDVCRIVFTSIEILLGALIIFVTIMRSIVGLKLCACGIGISAILNFLARIFSPVLGESKITHVIPMIVFLYLAIVVYRFGLLLEESEEVIDTRTTATTTATTKPRAAKATTKTDRGDAPESTSPL